MPGPALTVPFPYDLVIGTSGYVFADFMEDQDPTIFGQTQTFVQRSNTQGDYGDNQQDFWLTFSQKDWNKGEQQRYQGRDDDGKTRFWRGSNVDARIPGEVTMRKATTALTFAANVTNAWGNTSNDLVYATTSTTLYTVDYAGTISSLGAHGLGAAPSRWGICGDTQNIYMSTTSAGTVGVRRWNGSVFSTFTATGVDAVAYLNNTLYGYSGGATTATFYRIDAGGTANNLFEWKDASGDVFGPVTGKLIPFGGKLLILRYRNGDPYGATLWLFDGTAPAKIAEFPSNFLVYDCVVLSGTVFVSGAFQKHVSATVFNRPAIHFYKDGTQDLLWQADGYVSDTGTENAMSPPLAVYDGGLVWWDGFRNQVVYYNALSGGIMTVASYGTSASGNYLAAANTFFIVGTTGSTLGTLYPISTDVVATSAEVTTSLIDFDTSLRKVFRGVRVEYDAGTTGNGGTVDISYRFNDVAEGGSYTSLQTGAVSGTEYVFPTPAEGTTYQSVSVKVTLNKGTCTTDGPKLKRVKVRAVPVEPTFKRRRYVVSLGGIDGESPIQLRDGSYHAKDGKDMYTDLVSLIASTAPQTIIDEYGTYTGVLEGDKCEFRRTKSQQSVAVITAREV
jgi:hypothetical protein